MSNTKKSVIARNGIIIMLFFLVALFMFTRQASAATKVSSTSKPRIESTKYEGNGKVDIDFYGKVNLRNAKVIVKDTSGKKYKAKIIKRDDDDMDVKILNYKAGKTYKITVKNVKKRGSRKNYSVTTSRIKIPKATKSGAPKIKEVEFDADDNEVSFEFSGKVEWKNAKVTITGSNGKNLVVRIIEKDNDDIEVRVKGMAEGAKYSYKISGVRKIGASSYTTVSGSFRAIDD